MPRSLAGLVEALGHTAHDIRDLGLRGLPDAQVLAAAKDRDALVITRDQGFAVERAWPDGFTAGVIVVRPGGGGEAVAINRLVLDLLRQRLPESLLGAVTVIQPHRALSRVVRTRPRDARG